METDNIKIKTLFTATAFVVLIEGSVIFIASVIHLNSVLIIGIARFLETIIMLKIIVSMEGGLLSTGLKPGTITGGINRGLLWSFFFGLAAGFIFLILYYTGVDPLTLIHSQLPEKRFDIFLFLLAGCVISPVAEEIFFRGILYGFFRRWGVAIALLSTTLIFILAHHNIRMIPVTQAAGGIIFAASYEVEKSLMVPIVIHILGNTSIYVLSLVF